MMFVVPINCVTLLLMVAEIFYTGGSTNHNSSLLMTAGCLPFVQRNVVRLVFEFLIGVVAATFALMYGTHACGRVGV